MHELIFQCRHLEGVDPTSVGASVQVVAAAQNLIGVAMAMPGAQAAAKLITEHARYA